MIIAVEVIGGFLLLGVYAHWTFSLAIKRTSLATLAQYSGPPHLSVCSASACASAFPNDQPSIMRQRRAGWRRCRATGQGCPDYMSAPHVAQGELVPLLEEWRLDPMPMYVVFPPNRHISIKLRVFIDWVAELVAEHAPITTRPGS